MSAKSKKRLCKTQNKFEKLDKLQLKDVICSICQSIFIEPVTLPCLHCFCQRCFSGSIENNALCCPLCRLRIGSWLRTTTKQNSLVNIELWEYMKIKFSQEIETKLNGNDIDLPEEKPPPRLSAPGEIRSEYEAELQRLRAERYKIEQNHIEETKLLIEKIQQEEREAQKEYLERLKQDELLAQHIQKQEGKPMNTCKRRKSIKNIVVKSKAAKIDNYFSITKVIPNSQGPSSTLNESKVEPPAPEVVESDLLSIDSSTDSALKPIAKVIAQPSPELIPTYNKLKCFIDKKIKTTSNFWNKENGDKEKEEEKTPESDLTSNKNIVKDEDQSKGPTKSLLVSLPLPNSGILHHKINSLENKIADNDSVDSMRQELCFFKPIERTSSTSLKSLRGLPLRVPGVRAMPKHIPPKQESEPSRAQYLESLCRLRHLSGSKNLPSAFVLAFNMFKEKKEVLVPCEASDKSTRVRRTSNIPTAHLQKPSSKKSIIRAPNNSECNLRRTRSMGSIPKENATTPVKLQAKRRKAISERKPYLRSDSKKKEDESPPPVSNTINNNKVSLVVKNLSSPMENCDVKQILQEQLRIEKMIEQEQNDLELARRVDAELNGRRQLRRAPAKRQVTLNYTLRPTKKLKAS